jgi:hypothetical protein
VFGFLQDPPRKYWRFPFWMPIGAPRKCQIGLSDFDAAQEIDKWKKEILKIMD